MSSGNYQNAEVVTKKAATAVTASLGYATMFEHINIVIGGIGTTVGVIVTLYFANRRRVIYNQEEKINTQKIRINALQITEMEAEGDN